MKHFVGTCRGGPLDGQQLEGTTRFYRMVMRPRIQIKFMDPNEPPDASVTSLKYGSYQHVLGQWIWRDD